MAITALISNHIIDVHDGNNWTGVSVSDATKDVSWQQAQQKTAGSQNTIASLLHHLCYWNRVLLQRLEGKNPSIPETNGFDVGELKNDDDWKRLKESTHKSFIQLADAVKNFPEEKLDSTYTEGKSSYYKNLQGIVEHAHYHLGQIVILKNLINNK